MPITAACRRCERQAVLLLLMMVGGWGRLEFLLAASSPPATQIPGRSAGNVSVTDRSSSDASRESQKEASAPAGNPSAIPDPPRSPHRPWDFRLRAERVADGERIVLDGVLDEPVWERAAVADNFTQTEPQEGEPASEATQARVAYDRETLYISFVAYDRQVHEVIVNELLKDFNTSDGDVVGVVLDTFHDRRNGYEFATNPAGARWDAQMTNEGREVNTNWDGVWSVKTRVNGDGWVVEMAIPFRTLKFREGNQLVWGINFMRRLRRKNEESYWAPIPRMFGSIHYVSRAGVLEGLEGISSGSNLRIKPYVVGSVTDLNNGGPAFHRTYLGDVGVDLKWGITSGLTLDLSYNTDFSQVEADEQQVNLTRFSLFFPEKREFFLESSGIFRFGTPERMGMGPGAAAGGGRQGAVRDDMILFFSRRIGLSDSGEPIPLRGGVRLTGRAGPFELGLLNIQQEASATTPSTNFTVARFRRNILANSDIGAMFMNVAREGGPFHRIYGGDANFRFFQNLNLSAYLAKTAAPHLTGKNLAGRLALNWRNNFWETRQSYTNIQQNFDNPLGFVPRRGMSKWASFWGAHWRPTALRRRVREIFPHAQFDYINDPSGRLETQLIDYHLPITLQDGTFLEAGINSSYERLVRPFAIHPRVSIDPGRYRFNEYFFLATTDRSKPLSFTTRLATGPFYDGYRRQYSGGVALRVNYRLTTSLSYTRNNIDLKKGSFNADLFSFRAAYSFSTNVFLNALIQYNQTSRTWSSNIRFNIIHRPLSDLYVVYNERRDDGGRLLGRALIFKFTYLLSF